MFLTAAYRREYRVGGCATDGVRNRTQEAPGRPHREGISRIDLFYMFPDEDAAHVWLRSIRQPTRIGSAPAAEPMKPRQ